MTDWRTRDLFGAAVVFGVTAGVLESLSQLVYGWVDGARNVLGVYILWMPAAANLLLFLAVALLVWPLWRRWPGWVTPARIVGLLATLAAMSGLRRFDGYLSVISVNLLALGVGAQTGRWVTGRLDPFARLVRRLAPLVAALPLLAAAAVEARHRLRERAALAGVAVPDPAPPNVLLLVLDTVRSLNLSLYGYGPRTTPALEALAARGTAFRQALSTAPWTLPSHAGMFTGHWAHELNADWETPLDGRRPTLAGELARQGYRTGGFVGNLVYAAAAEGIDRGFSHYEDFPVSLSQVLRSAATTRWLCGHTPLARWLAPGERFFVRKSAADINRGFLTWLDREPEARPFFAFLNYYDAHEPYRPAPPFDTAFAAAAYPPLPPSRHGGTWKDDIPRSMREYDRAIATIDHEIGRLLDSLAARGRLEHTLIIVTADHGEEFGEHGLYGHGHSLYLPSLSVPLLLVLPGTVPAGVTVDARVTLRDLPATVMALTGLSGDFPGMPLTRYLASAGLPADTLLVSTRKARNRPDWDRTGHGDLQGVVVGDLQLIRDYRDSLELYDLARDPGATRDLHDSPALAPVAAALRGLLQRRLGSPGPGAEAR